MIVISSYFRVILIELLVIISILLNYSVELGVLEKIRMILDRRPIIFLDFAEHFSWLKHFRGIYFRGSQKQLVILRNFE